jgi:hypothetical protein
MNDELPKMIQGNIETLVKLAGKDNQFLQALIRSTVELSYRKGFEAGINHSIEIVRERTVR